MELLLLSSSRTRAGYFTDYLPAIKDFTAGTRRAVFLPFAAVSLPWDEYAAKVSEAIALALHPPEELPGADLVVVGGGNTFPRYLGWSAGANLACPTIKTTNDMPIVDPGGLEALGLVAFQINPHYVNATFAGQHGETRDERLAEFARANPGLPVIGLPEGDWLRVSGVSVELHGAHPAVWFDGEKVAIRIEPGSPTPFGDSL
jgi:dipeptidase E